VDRSITPRWKFVAIVLEATPVWIAGLDAWKQEWHRLDRPAITVAHPQYPEQRHSMFVYELSCQTGLSCLRPANSPRTCGDSTFQNRSCARIASAEPCGSAAQLHGEADAKAAPRESPMR
jgi:hypothetical protein